MKRIFIIGLAQIFSCGVAWSQKNVIMYIGDGFGIAPKTATRMALGQGTDGKRFTSDPGFQVLALDKLRYQATVTTHSQNSWITDSGPGASVYAGGVDGKVDNEAISFNPKDGKSIKTILEAAKEAGYAVGLVTTTRVTHATPAAFGSHIWFRDLEDYIAAQFISKDTTQYRDIYRSTANGYNPNRDWDLPEPKQGVEIDVILGGGFRHFFPNGLKDTLRDKTGTAIINPAKNAVFTMSGKRSDGANLIKIAKERGYQYVNTRDALMNLNVDAFSDPNKKLIGLFNASHCSYEQDRQQYFTWEPSLPDMVNMAIQVLKKKGGAKGFFLMVEGGRIDHLSHANSGGIAVVNKKYVVDSDKEVYLNPDGTPNGESIYAPDTLNRNTGVYGSDYMIKEVLAYDYAVGEGRKLLDESSKTLIFCSSDHECGGTAVVALHDEGNLQNNGTKIRTYASGPRQNGASASSGGGPSATTYPTPNNIQRGDVDFASMNPAGWFPDYTMVDFQGRTWPKPSTATARRIVIAYGSNPQTNGNGDKLGGTPGNHTPQDVLVTADDNNGGSHASMITGQGLLDNTYLTHIMADFLNVNVLTSNLDNFRTLEPVENSVYPNPTSGQVSVSFYMEGNSEVSFDLFDESGLKIGALDSKALKSGNNSVSFDLSAFTQKAGVYFLNIHTKAETISKKIIKK